MFKTIIIKIQSLILITLTVTITMLTYNSERSYAFDRSGYVTIAEAALAAEAAAETGATIVLAPEVATCLVIGAVAYGGYTLATTYGDSVVSYIKSTFDSLTYSEVNDYFYESGGRAGLTSSGISWAQNKVKSRFIDSASTSVSVPKPTNTTPSLSAPFYVNNFTMQAVPYLNASGTTLSQTIGKVFAGDSLIVFMGPYSTSAYTNTGYQYTYTYTYNRYFKVQYEPFTSSGTPYTRAVLYVSDDGVSGWTMLRQSGYWTTGTSGTVFGYRTTSDTIGVGTSDVFVPSIAPSTLTDGQSLTLPVTQTTSTDGITRISTNLDPKTVSPGNFTITDISTNTDTSTDTSTDTDTNTQPDVSVDPDTISEGIQDTLEVPSDDVPTLDFSPLQVATQKFPFSIPWDLWDTYKVFEGDPTPFYYKFNEISINGSITDYKDFVVIPEFEINFADYPVIDDGVKVFRYLFLMGFIVFIILRTRTLIRG